MGLLFKMVSFLLVFGLVNSFSLKTDVGFKVWGVDCDMVVEGMIGFKLPAL